MSARALLTSLPPMSSHLTCRTQAQKARQITSWISSSCRFEQRRRISSPSRNLYLPRSRQIHTTSAVRHGDITRPEPGTGIKVHFKDAKGNDIKTVEANEGDDLLSIAHEHDIDLEGACEGSIACSTCHVILSPGHYDLLPEPSDDENDMLDMAFGLTDTSRLGCQVRLTKELDGMTAQLPSATRNMFVDGKKPTHH
ncbi:ferredoxin [Gloeophyllum trabeum ATCC 11539]|uniref:Ferredoxin n=1 Tax=Gloeophyllum trabeum (strain ATCC 11539 / FP-39264 / Madison 617) TaxID=670483 RepID=S7PWG1_GLOTA|nr:ferredoxin [Gloeophyllum trabeum ATCC 11539]EPQ51961.1 ferredoxin [Gloeophyllum trabeum ATCC 11539]